MHRSNTTTVIKKRELGLSTNNQKNSRNFHLQKKPRRIQRPRTTKVLMSLLLYYSSWRASSWAKLWWLINFCVKCVLLKEFQETYWNKIWWLINLYSFCCCCGHTVVNISFIISWEKPFLVLVAVVVFTANFICVLFLFVLLHFLEQDIGVHIANTSLQFSLLCCCFDFYYKCSISFLGMYFMRRVVQILFLCMSIEWCFFKIFFDSFQISKFFCGLLNG